MSELMSDIIQPARARGCHFHWDSLSRLGWRFKPTDPSRRSLAANQQIDPSLAIDLHRNTEHPLGELCRARQHFRSPRPRVHILLLVWWSPVYKDGPRLPFGTADDIERTISVEICKDGVFNGGGSPDGHSGPGVSGAGLCPGFRYTRLTPLSSQPEVISGKPSPLTSASLTPSAPTNESSMVWRTHGRPSSPTITAVIKGNQATTSVNLFIIEVMIRDFHRWYRRRCGPQGSWAARVRYRVRRRPARKAYSRPAFRQERPALPSSP